jgi:hypothetical protein
MRPNGRLVSDTRNDLLIKAGRITPLGMSLTVEQITNFNGLPKAAELIEITGAHALEASDRAIFNQLLQIAHDSDRLTEPDAEWEITLASLRRASSKHESNDRVRASLRRLQRTEVKVTYVSTRTGKKRVMETTSSGVHRYGCGRGKRCHRAIRDT